jgi:hypothetical protein
VVVVVVAACCWWAGIHRPAAAAACQSFFYDFYKELTELSANNSRLLFCWPSWSSVASPNSAVTSWCGSSGDKDKQGGEPAPGIQIDPVASVPHKTRGLCVLQDAQLIICFFLYAQDQDLPPQALALFALSQARLCSRLPPSSPLRPLHRCSLRQSQPRRTEECRHRWSVGACVRACVRVGSTSSLTSSSRPSFFIKCHALSVSRTTRLSSHCSWNQGQQLARDRQ